MKKFERITMSGPEILDYPATSRILENLKRFDLLPNGYTAPEVVDATQMSHKLAFEAMRRQAPDNHPVALGKRILHLTTQPGVFIKQCPGSNNMLCCHYHVVNMVSNCPFDCSYCYLQTYLNQPMVTFYVNENDIFDQVRKICERPPVAQLRVGTGEIADSLALDPITEFSVRLADVMGEFENVQLELKTKSKNVEHLLGMKRKNHVLISWSINPPEIIDREEHGTARFEERLAAAAAAAKAGFDIAFHFDPMIHFPGWEQAYERAVVRLVEVVGLEKLTSISMGALRYQPQLKAFALKRRPDTTIFFDESVSGDDGKIRYLRQTRTDMFAFMNSLIQKHAPKAYTYLCMETKPVWQNAMGRLPDRGF
jgi:spore photoproduct lyase